MTSRHFLLLLTSLPGEPCRGERRLRLTACRHEALRPEFLLRHVRWRWRGVAEIPPGTWRDCAYAEYPQQALNSHNNPEASRWALDQIGDTTFKNEAESWGSNWEKRTGWKAQ